MISGFSDVSLSPKTNIIYRWRDQDTSNVSRKSQNISQNNIVANLNKNGESDIYKMLEKSGTEKTDVLTFPENPEYGINIFRKT